jgi:UDP-3-O-[3-hydroxymyristoyl] glucosamine N-acyltransferase
MTTLAELAQLVGGRLQGDGELEISDAATLHWAQPGQISLLESVQYQRHLSACHASALVVPPALEAVDRPAIVAEHCAEAFARIVAHFRPLPQSSFRGISPAAHIHPSARLADGVTVYPGACLGEQVHVGAGTIIYSGCHLMAGVQVGANCTLFPNVVAYEGTRIGNRVIVHANAVLGSYGFGYTTVKGRHQLSAQLGCVEIHDDVEIGAGTTIDRGTYDATVIGEGTKIDNLVMVAHNCRIGRHNILCSQVGIAGSCTTGDYVVMAGQVGVRDHVEIGEGARLGAKAGIAHSIPAGATYYGIPARPEKEERLMVAALIKLPEMRRQFKALERRWSEMEERLRDAQATAKTNGQPDAA